MDLGKTALVDVVDGVEIGGEQPPLSKDATTEAAPATPKIVEPDPSDDGNPSSDGRRVARAKEKRHNRTRSDSRRMGWKYPNGPPVPQPNQEPLTLEQCLNLTERDLFKRHEYHKTSVAQKDVYIQYLKFLIETSGRLLYPPGPSPRAPSLCTTSFGSDFSRFLDDVHYDGDDNIRWIPHRVATPAGGASRDWGNEQPEKAADSVEGDNQEHPPASGSNIEGTQTGELTPPKQEPKPARTQPEKDKNPAQATPEKEDTVQPEYGPGLRKAASHDVVAVDGLPAVLYPKGNADERGGEGPGATVTLPEKTPVSPAIPTGSFTAPDSEIRGPLPTGRSPRSAILDPERVSDTGRLQGGGPTPHRPKSRGISGSMLPIPYQSDQERLWLKYHEMQLHFDAEIDEMDARMKALQEHLVRVGGSTDTNGVSRAGGRTKTSGNDRGKGKINSPKTETMEFGGAWLQNVRKTIDRLKEMAAGPKRTLRPPEPEIGQPAEPTNLLPMSGSTGLASAGTSDSAEAPKANPTMEGTPRSRTLNELPYEILSTILKYLPMGKRATLSVTCRLWHQVMTPMIWRSVNLDDGYEIMIGQRRAYQELKRVAANSEEKGKGKQTASVQTFWPIACLTVQTSLSSGDSPEVEKAPPTGSEPTESEGNDNTDKIDGARPGNGKEWWERGLQKRTRETPKNGILEISSRDRAICYNESLALMPATISLLTALSNPKLAVHVRTLYTNIAASPWPIDGGQDITLSGDLIRHLCGLRAQAMRQILALIKRVVRNLTRVENLTVKSHDPKITNALLGILCWSPKLVRLDIIEADLGACQLSRGRGKVPAYEVLKKIVEDSGAPEEVKAEQIKVIDQPHTEAGWMHCLPTVIQVREDAAETARQKTERPNNGLRKLPAALDAEGNGDHEDGSPATLPPTYSDKEQSVDALDTSTTSTQENKEGRNGDDIQSVAATSSGKRNGKEKQNNEVVGSIALTVPEFRQKFSHESMNRSLWNPVEITAYDARSDQGSSAGSEAEPCFRFAKERGHNPPPRKRHDGSYFYPALTHLNLQSCFYGTLPSNSATGRPPPTPRKAIRATVLLRRFLTRCPNLQVLTVRDCTIQPEALFDFGSPRRAVWWKSIYGQTLMDAAVGPFFMTEMQCTVEVPFEEDLYGMSSGSGQQQNLTPPPPPPSHHPDEGGESSGPAGTDVTAEQHAGASPTKTDDPRRLAEKVWKSLRDNNNRLLTFPDLEALNIDNCGTFLSPEIPYRWISSPGFKDFFLRHHKLQRLSWDGYILNRHLQLNNPIFLKTAHHLGRTLKTLILSHVGCAKGSPSVPHQIPPTAAHQKAFSFPRLNAFLRCLKVLEFIELFVDLMPTSQIVGIARTLRNNNITHFSLGRAKGVVSAADVDALVECLPNMEVLNIIRWRPKDFIHAFPEARDDPPGYGELVYEEDENFPTQDEEADQRSPWFSVAELATKVSCLPNLTNLALNYTFPISEDPPLSMSPNEIYKILCDDRYYTHDEIIAASTTPGTPQSVWIREYLDALRTTAEIFASTPQLTKLSTITLGYFIHDCQSRGSVSIIRDEEGKPLRYECYQLPEYVWGVMTAHDIDTVGGPLRYDDEESADGIATDGEPLDEKAVDEKVVDKGAADGKASSEGAVDGDGVGGQVAGEKAEDKVPVDGRIERNALAKNMGKEVVEEKGVDAKAARETTTAKE
ncbi:MAG: hypothetical protein M1839_002551 [Geoglossum umbratile]|nr:MAG: hypothetical protein M1839_002551 [Geoglossum umbratile]